MKTHARTAVIAGGLLAGALGAAAASPTGTYVEARTCSVFAGACHYNGEVVADGREAVSAWHFDSGAWNGVSLGGLSAIAVVRADDNLGKASAHRATMLWTDARATPAQQQALDQAIAARYAAALGTVSDAGTVTITFVRKSNGGFKVSAPEVASLDVDALPNRECCKQPNLVWYQPLAPVSDRRVGYTETASCTARTGGDPWTRGNENSAFYGTFTF